MRDRHCSDLPVLDLDVGDLRAEDEARLILDEGGQRLVESHPGDRWRLHQDLEDLVPEPGREVLPRGEVVQSEDRGQADDFAVAHERGNMFISQGQFTVGELVTFMTYLDMLVWPLQAMGYLVNISQRGAISYERIEN